MNVILLLIDSLNRHHLQPYGCDFVRTPSLQAFAERGVTMTRHFAGSLPCMPARREIMAGVREFPWRGWGHTEAFDDLLPECARRQGCVTKLITDHYHYFEHASHGYFESFLGYDFIRGQELDAWKTEPAADLPPWIERVNAFRPDLGTHYYRNVRGFREEHDWFTPQVFGTVQSWLRDNRRNPFFLFIDHFEVHEPFFCAEPYRSLYTDEPAGSAFNIWPPYQNAEQSARFFAEMDAREMAYLRSQYYGKVTWVDAYIGRLMETLDDLRLWEDTMVIITTDHGHDLAEWRPLFGKQPPHHDSHANLPLLVWHPQYACDGRRVGALTSTVDLHATVREALGEVNPESPNSRSFLPVLRSERETHRQATLCGTFGAGVLVADDEFSYVHQPTGAPELFWYSGYLPRDGHPELKAEATSGPYLPQTSSPVWRIPIPHSAAAPSGEHRLYRHSEADPSASPNVIADAPEIAQAMRAVLRRTLEEDGCPPEQYRRLGLENL